MITLISVPEYIEPLDPTITDRWVATESPNNFRLLRHDFDIVTAADNGGFLRLTVAAGTFTGTIGDVIAVYNKTLNAMYAGEVQAGSTTTIIDTDIAFIIGFDPTDPALDPTRLITYINDNTLHAGYYFEGRLTINGILNPLTIIASPDSFGYADLDVSGILRIVTSIGKTGDYTALIMAEPTKSGNFFLEYRECWYGSNNSWTISELAGSPPSYPLWYYGEAVRSEEQGSNLYEYVPNDVKCAPFLNSFDNPVYFAGLPWDISFIMPECGNVSPTSDIMVTINTFNSNNVLLSSSTQIIPVDDLEGFVCSLTIDPAFIQTDASHFTIDVYNG